MSGSFTHLFPRAAGVLMPLASLPSRHGIGDLGPEAFRFVDWLASAGVTWWQMLPVVPLGPGNSPYASSSAFATEPLYLSLEVLAEEGLLAPSDLAGPKGLREGNVRYAGARRFKAARLTKAFETWRSSRRQRAAFARFCDREAAWLEPFCAASGSTPADLDRARFFQFQLDRQWRALRAYARERGVLLMGDAPIFVALDSVDVTSRPELFRLDREGQPEVLSGCPPDSMNEDGQLWGHPHYDWPAHRAEGYGWWRARMRRQMDLFEAIRLDHFIGFRNAWEVPAAAESAREGVWGETPGEELLEAIRAELGALPVIAEDLGTVTDAVHDLRERFELPGMRVLQWGFGAGSFHAPHAIDDGAVVYPATHDNDTCAGWWRGADPVTRKRFRAATGGGGKTVGMDMIRAACATRAHTALFQLQDVLGLGSSARMNTPGTPSGNWAWRVARRDLTVARARQLHELLDATDRLADR